MLPSGTMARNMQNYFAGKGTMVPIDIASGESLSQLTHHPASPKSSSSGGNIMWSLLAVGIYVLLFTLYKLVYLKRVHGDTDKHHGRGQRSGGEGRLDQIDEHHAQHQPITTGRW